MHNKSAHWDAPKRRFASALLGARGFKRYVIKMKTPLCIFLTLLLPVSSDAGEWVRVNGGVHTEKFDLRNIESKLWNYIDKVSKVKFQPREKYIYQYKVVNNEEIYINALCDINDKKDLENEIIVVFDGGSCFFQINYNLKKDSFSELQENGDA